ncbi:MAG: MaoC/PaaZ C-terminal domain-containing protein [Dehalococcoidia bacterium]|nr:MaoC/PaaZ C-terminal domain-containing protein [Dehalococcoidia bacterium]
MAQVYFEDVEEGQEVPTLVQNCDSQRLVLWAAGSGDYYQIHYDKDFAQATGLADRIVHGALKHALLGRMLHEWIGERGRVRRLACQYRGMDMVDKDVVCKGVVKSKRQEDGAGLVDLEIWTEDPAGNKTTPGTATVKLPTRV